MQEIIDFPRKSTLLTPSSVEQLAEDRRQYRASLEQLTNSARTLMSEMQRAGVRSLQSEDGAYRVELVTTGGIGEETTRLLLNGRPLLEAAAQASAASTGE